MKSENRRVCVVKITPDNKFTGSIISVYLPCNTYNQQVQKKYADTFDHIECLISSIECDSVIICGDYNTSFEREAAQVDYLNDFISRNNLKIYCDNNNVMKDFTSGCIFDRIMRNNVIYDVTIPQITIFIV